MKILDKIKHYLNFKEDREIFEAWFDKEYRELKNSIMPEMTDFLKDLAFDFSKSQTEIETLQQQVVALQNIVTAIQHQLAVASLPQQQPPST